MDDVGFRPGTRRDIDALVPMVRDFHADEGIAWNEASLRAALADLLTEFPSADRQHLRQLVRNAGEERRKNKPPHAFREIFRELRELLGEPGMENEESEMEEDE